MCRIRDKSLCEGYWQVHFRGEVELVGTEDSCIYRGLQVLDFFLTSAGCRDHLSDLPFDMSKTF